MLIEAQSRTDVINPRPARDFAKALGVLAKTDALEAGVLARFGQSIQPHSWKDSKRLEAGATPNKWSAS